jgi:hypothetical protein
MKLSQMPDLVGTSEIAERSGNRKGTVAQWHHRGLLPEPIADLASGPVWTWPEVEAFLITTDRWNDAGAAIARPAETDLLLCLGCRVATLGPKCPFCGKKKRVAHADTQRT